MAKKMTKLRGKLRKSRTVDGKIVDEINLQHDKINELITVLQKYGVID
jgi:hypothetical protein